MQRTLAANAHRLHYAMADDDQTSWLHRRQHVGRNEGPHLESDAGLDAFEITLRGVRARAAAHPMRDDLDAISAQRSALAHSKAGQRVFAALNASMGARDGMCKHSTGAFDRQTCKNNASAPWLPPRPLIRNVHGLRGCVELCARCAKCGQVSYSLMLGLCAWHFACDPDNPKHMSTAWELWTYRTFRLNASTKLLIEHGINDSRVPWMWQMAQPRPLSTRSLGAVRLR